MSIFNSFAALASSGLEYETGTTFITSATSSLVQVTFSNTHTNPPALAMIVQSGSVSSSYTTFAMAIVYGALFGITGRGGSANYYAQRISGRGTTTSMTVNNSYTSSNYTDVIKTSSVQFSSNSNYPFGIGTYYWIAIWK